MKWRGDPEINPTSTAKLRFSSVSRSVVTKVYKSWNKHKALRLLNSHGPTKRKKSVTDFFNLTSFTVSTCPSVGAQTVRLRNITWHYNRADSTILTWVVGYAWVTCTSMWKEILLHNLTTKKHFKHVYPFPLRKALQNRSCLGNASTCDGVYPCDGVYSYTLVGLLGILLCLVPLNLVFGYQVLLLYLV